MRILIAVLVTLPLTGPTFARDGTAGPEEVVRDYFHSLRDHGFAGVVEFMHPDEMSRFKAMLVPLIEADAQSGERDLLDSILGPKASLADVKSMSPKDFMRACMSMIDAQLDQTRLSFDKVDVLGSVKEDDILHVVSRLRFGVDDIVVTQMEVISLRQYKGDWKLLLTGEMEGLAQALRARDNRT